MDENELGRLVKDIDTATLKAEAKRLGLKCGRCPTKMTIARLLPDDVLRSLVKK
jgi:hypothetical protein